MQASRTRLFKGYKEVQRAKAADPDIQLVCDDSNIFKWTAVIKTPYEGGVFQLAFAVPEQQPLQPPQVRFLTKVFHPNVHFRKVLRSRIMYVLIGKVVKKAALAKQYGRVTDTVALSSDILQSRFDPRHIRKLLLNFILGSRGLSIQSHASFTINGVISWPIPGCAMSCAFKKPSKELKQVL
ncbi:hypothetical protein V6N11_007680 [Hibiscus sabdariffa]|uniref:UBC core domain-containing protein n=2 Tax=Hibiscus sabdariffa TaxID=183260 RepID=A0ABR2NJ37_9ROSI